MSNQDDGIPFIDPNAWPRKLPHVHPELLEIHKLLLAAWQQCRQVRAQAGDNSQYSPEIRSAHLSGMDADHAAQAELEGDAQPHWSVESRLLSALWRIENMADGVAAGMEQTGPADSPN